MASGVVLFAGPSAHGLDTRPWRARGDVLRPPAARGDIDAWVAAQPRPGVLVLCDGVFQGRPAVSHAELCRALDAGWAVWGVSSMGAIRAHELRQEGMRGHGWVARQFAQRADFRDDELALQHFPEPPYFAVSEPLVNLRYAIARQGRACGLGAAAQRRVLGELQDLWFGERTLPRMRQALLAPGGLAPAQADALLAWMAVHRIKALDLARLMRLRPWAA